MSQETWHNNNDEIPPEKNPKELGSETFGRLCEEHLTSVLKFLARFGTKGMPTEDMTQEVFLRACKHFRRSQPPSDAKAFLLGIAKNVHREEQRRRRKPQVISFADLSEETARLIQQLPQKWFLPDNDGFCKLIEQAKAKLPPDQRQAIELVHTQNLSIPEAAKAANCRCTKQFRNRLYRARKHLRSLLSNLLWGRQQ